MAQSKTSTIGLVELPQLGLIDPTGKNWLVKDRHGALISKQILLSSLQGLGFKTQLINLRKGHYQEEYGKVSWRNTKLAKICIGERITDNIRYGVIIGFEDDSEDSLLRLEEALFELYEDLKNVSPCLKFQINALTLSPIPGTPQSNQVRQSELLHFDEPSLYGSIWTPTIDTRYLSYEQVADWQMRLMRIGSEQYMDYSK